MQTTVDELLGRISFNWSDLVHVDREAILSLEDGPGLDHRMALINEEDRVSHGGTVSLFVDGVYPVHYEHHHVHFETGGRSLC